MPIYFPCPACEYEVKVKDELASRKIKCPGCSKIIAVPALDHLEEVEDSPPTRGARKVDKKPARKNPPRGQDEEMLPSIKKKKAVPATGLKQYHEAFNNFDIKRFTPLGWLLFVIAVILGLFGAYLVNANYDLIMGAPDPNEVIIRKYYLPIGLGAAVGGLGTFFGGMGLLFLLGVKVIRPKMDDAE